MHIAVVGPIAGEDVRAFLHGNPATVPRGYRGAPLTAILMGELLRLGHRVTGITVDASLPLSEGPVHLFGPSFSFVVCPARPRAWRLNGWRLGRAVDFFAFERKLLSKAISAAAPDLVHAHWSYEFAMAALDQPAPHLITCHDSPAVVLRLSRSPYRAVRYLMARRVFRLGKEFSTVSDYMARALESRLGRMLEVVPNPVAEHVFALGRPRPMSSSRRVAMVCNGWDRWKNPEPALRAFALWRKVEPAAELHCFGADFGPEGKAARWALVQGLAAGTSFCGRLPHGELATALAEMDALLHPSLEESFGVVLAEAMALGLPVVAGRHSGAVPWVLGADADGQCGTGVLTDVTSTQAIVKALVTLFDPDYPGRSMAGFQRARHLYSTERVVTAYQRRYLDILSTQPSPLSY